MKRKTILASAMALALMIAPFSGLSVSAEEGSAAPAQESRAANTPHPTPTILGFENYWHLGYSWINGSSQGSIAHIQLLKDGEVYCETFQSVRGSKGENTLPLSSKIADTGTYQAKLWMEDPGTRYLSDPVTSVEVSYQRPDAVLDTTVGHWDAEQEGLFHYPAVKDAVGYEWRLLKLNEETGQWDAIIQYGSSTVQFDMNNGVAFEGGGPNSPKDAGGEDKTKDYTREIQRYGAGSYCVTVRALSGQIAEIANGEEGAMSEPLVISGASSDGGSDNSDDSDDSDDSAQSGSSALPENQIAVAKPGEVVKVTKEQNVTCLSNSDMKQLLERGVTLEMEYTYEGVDYKIRIPAGTAMDNDIPWYGPLYLAQYYSTERSYISASGNIVTVKKGDTLGKIARANNMTLDELKAKNPQIQDVNRIVPGQNIVIK